MLGRDLETSGTTGHTADGFVEFFSCTADDVMSATAGHPAPTVVDSAPSSLSFFRPCSKIEVYGALSRPLRPEEARPRHLQHSQLPASVQVQLDVYVKSGRESRP